MKLLSWIIKMRSREIGISGWIKYWYKKKKFNTMAKTGQNLDIRSVSDCRADKPGNIKIGDNCRIHGTLQSMQDGVISVGNNTCIYLRSTVGSVCSVTIGHCVIISNHVHIFDNNNHPVNPDVRHNMCLEGFEGEAWRWTHADAAPVVIEDDVWIGEGATILKGVTIGKGSVIGCQAVVTKDVPPYCIAAGNPARVVKEIVHES